MPASSRALGASLLRRFASMAYETLLLAGVLAVTLVLPQVLIGATTQRVTSANLLWAHLFLVLAVYCVGFWTRGGQTLAMKTWRIRLVNERGEGVRPAQALLRYLLCWPSFALCGVGLLWALLDPDRLFLHDRLAGTRLIGVAK